MQPESQVKHGADEATPAAIGSVLGEGSAGPLRIPLPREDKLSARAFHEGYVTSLQPVILTGKMADWPALSLWCPEYFATTWAQRWCAAAGWCGPRRGSG